MNAALPGGDVRLFELLPDGMIRVLSPGKGQGGQLKTTLETPRRLLSYLNCSAQWEAPFLAAPGAGRPGPGQRSGVPDHGPGGNLDSAADGAPARQ